MGYGADEGNSDGLNQAKSYDRVQKQLIPSTISSVMLNPLSTHSQLSCKGSFENERE